MRLLLLETTYALFRPCIETSADLRVLDEMARKLSRGTVFNAVVCAIVVLLVAIGFIRDGASKQDVLQRVFRDQQVFEVFLNSDQVTAQRLKMHPKEGTSFGRLADY